MCDRNKGKHGEQHHRVVFGVSRGAYTYTTIGFSCLGARLVSGVCGRAADRGRRGAQSPSRRSWSQCTPRQKEAQQVFCRGKTHACELHVVVGVVGDRKKAFYCCIMPVPFWARPFSDSLATTRNTCIAHTTTSSGNVLSKMGGKLYRRTSTNYVSEEFSRQIQHFVKKKKCL